MPNVAQVLKAEIARIAKHEAKVAVAPPKKTSIANTKALVGIKRRLAQIEKSLGAIQKTLNACCSGQTPVPESTGVKAWLTGKGIKSLRKKMRVSQAAFGKLVGASMAAVLRWEKQVGKLTFRGDTLAKIVALRGVGVQESQRRLAAMGKRRK
jgi:DNA-binding transcriptional regulator YiaG